MALPGQQTPLWAQRASARPLRLLSTLPLAFAFTVLFNTGIISTFTLLVLLLPLFFFNSTRLWYLHVGKGAFGRLLVLVLQLFSPTELVLSAAEGLNETWVERDESGKAVKLNLPPKSVWVSNHTTLADWLYIWSFAYLSGHASSLYIALKSSLRRIPVIGWGCHLFGFAFLERKWAEDRAPFAAQLERIAEETNRGGEAEKMAFLLFPEGTIVTENTRSVSQKFAQKSGVTDFKHLLLPRSTGLFFALRKLARSVPTLHLIDLTMSYPLPRAPPTSGGTKVPAAPQYASEFYTLPSILLQGISPPELHVHVRAFQLRDIPLGALESVSKEGARTASDGLDGTPEEREAFDRWLRDRWQEKDQLIEQFRTQGTFVAPSPPPTGGSSDDDVDDERPAGEVVWPIGLRHPLVEAPAAFAFALPFLVLWALWGWPKTFISMARTARVEKWAALAGSPLWKSS